MRITSCNGSDNLILTVHPARLVLHIVFRRLGNRGGRVSPDQDVVCGKVADRADIVGEIHVNPPAIEIGDVAGHVLAELLIDSYRALHIVGRVKMGIDRKSGRGYGTDGPREVGHWLIGVIEVRIVDGKAPLIRNL